jgi:hypothetical protein
MRRSLLIFCLALMALACGKPSDEEYGRHFHKVMSDYTAAATQLASQPLPDRSMPREERLKALSAAMDRVAALHQRIAKELRKETPSDRYAQVHAAACALFDRQARLNFEYAGLVRERSPRAREVGDQAQQAMFDDLKRLVEELEKLEGPQPRFRQLIKDLEQGGAR